jgi:hypothetical protein
MVALEEHDMSSTLQEPMPTAWNWKALKMELEAGGSNQSSHQCCGFRQNQSGCSTAAAVGVCTRM